MKVKRQKKVAKVLSFYSINFGMKAPYNVLVDGTFCKAALEFKVNIREQLPRYLEGEVAFYTTSCALAECESLGSLLYGPLKILREYDVADCSHSKPINAAECLKRVAFKERHRKKYFVATKDLLLSEKVRSKAGIPLLFIDGHTIVLEAPSEKSKKRAARAATDKMQTEHGALAAMKEQLLEGEKQHKKKRKRKGPKGPNPLSCKKPKNPKDKLSAVEDGKVTKKRKRSRHKRARVADHLKEHFKKLSLE